MSEAQLIGRGARYFPFKLDNTQEPFQRKYDFDINHELRICETLIYHCTYNPKYLQELNSALQEIGLKPKETVTQRMFLKEDFKKSSIYENGLIFLNSRRKRSADEFPTFLDYFSTKNFKSILVSGRSRLSLPFEQSDIQEAISYKKIDMSLKDVGRHILREAINKNIFFRFSNIQTIFPTLRSMSDFIESESYLGSIIVEVSSVYSSHVEFDACEKFYLASDVMNQIEIVLSGNQTEYLGSFEFTPTAIKEVFKDKEMQFNIDEGSEQEFGVSINSPGKTAYHLDISSRKWFAYSDFFGTSEEKLLVHFLDKKMSSLETKYRNIYLLRNEKFFKLYNFVNGQAIEPDFILVLEGKERSSTFYQIFIEPKGPHLVKNDGWKEQFLTSIRSQGRIAKLLANSEFIVWGLPFYTNEDERTFDQIFKEDLQIDKKH
jgi:type III restriction enzyme